MNFTRKIKDGGYSLARPRKKIMELFKNNREPLSAEQIRKKAGNVDPASVYRNLKIFIELGLLQMELRNGGRYYYHSDKPHHHIVCRRCGYTRGLPCREDFSGLTD